jgi:hypothetical protein
MKIQLFTGVAMACAAAALAAQTASKPNPDQKPGSTAQTLTLSGCVSAGTAATDPFTLTHPTLLRGTGPAAVTVTNGTVSGAVSADNVSATAGVPAGAATQVSPTLATPPGGMVDPAAMMNIAQGYRLSGSDLKRYAGRRVEIVGGLTPSANAAATAGAASSGVVPETGVAGTMNSTPRSTATSKAFTLPELRVESVKPIDGPCPPR